MPDQPRVFGQPDPRNAARRLEDLRRVQRQVLGFLAGQADASFGERLLAFVQDGREARGLDIRFGEIPSRDGGTTLARDAELLIRRESLPQISGILDMYQLQPVAIEGPLDGRVYRLTGSAGARDELAQVASNLRTRGIAISANYVTPLGALTKCLAGPEETSGRAPVWPLPEKTRRRKRSPVRVVLIDTGVMGDRTDGWINDLVSGDNGELLDAAPPVGYLDLAAGHGTFCAGIVQQIAPDAEIVVRSVVESDGFADEVAVAEAIVTEAQQGIAAGQHTILSLSLGTETADDERPVAFGVALEIVEEMQAASDREVLVVAAAGNYGRDRPCYPAAFPSVIAVAAVTQGLLPASWSSRGAWVDVSTIGEGVRSTYVPGKESPAFDPDPDTFGRNAWALWTGTSFAAPQVAGALARIAIEDGISPSAARRVLTQDAPEIPLYGKRVEILPHI